MPGIQRPVDRTEPADDDELWTRRFERQSTKVEQDGRVCHHIVLLSFLRFLMHDFSGESNAHIALWSRWCLMHCEFISDLCVE